MDGILRARYLLHGHRPSVHARPRGRTRRPRRGGGRPRRSPRCRDVRAVRSSHGRSGHAACHARVGPRGSDAPRGWFPDTRARTPPVRAGPALRVYPEALRVRPAAARSARTHPVVRCPWVGAVGGVVDLHPVSRSDPEAALMPGPFVHHIDPIIGTIGGVHLWWYGLSYSAGFLNAFLFLRRRRPSLGLSERSLYNLVLLLAIGVLLGGRSLVVFSNEWSFYREHPSLIPAVWIGGLATHGLIVGGAAGVFAFCILWKRPFRPIFDVLAVAAAVILGFGRIGNFIDGQIVGSLTSVPWAVRFPEADGFRHPVVLYDGFKNFLLVPLLIWVERRGAPPGRVAALFVFLYSVLRIPIDLLRDYPITTFGLPTGQAFNLIMVTVGLALMLKSLWRPTAGLPARHEPDAPAGWRRWAFIAVMVFAMVIPSDATRDVPERYGRRHPGLEHSAMYPNLPDDLGRR